MFTDVSWVPSIRTPLLTDFFNKMPALVHLNFLLIVIALGYWCLNRRFFRDFAIVLSFSWTSVNILKAIFRLPRPTIEHIISIRDGSYTFPSGDAQLAATFWIMLACYVRKTWFSVLAAIVILCVMCSRVYLGVHYPRDVITGALIGGALVAFFYSSLGQFFINYMKSHLIAWIGFLIAWVFIYLKVVVLGQITPLHVTTLGFFVGTHFGLILFRLFEFQINFIWYDSLTFPTKSKLFFTLFSLLFYFFLKPALTQLMPALLPLSEWWKTAVHFCLGLYVTCFSFLIYHAFCRIFLRNNIFSI